MDKCYLGNALISISLQHDRVKINQINKEINVAKIATEEKILSKSIKEYMQLQLLGKMRQ